MKVILIDWNAYGNKNIEDLFAARGYDVRKVSFDGHAKGTEKDKALKDLRGSLDSFSPDYVFSYHYFPDVSNACEEARVPYISWIYDSPAFDLYSPTILNSVNRIFVFDRGVYEEFDAGGITTVHHLPLGVVCRDPATGRPAAGAMPPVLSGSTDVAMADSEYIADISFIGSMYTEPKHRLYDKFKDIDPYAHGYLDGLIEAQKHIYGMNFLEHFITPEIEAEMQKGYPTDPNSTNAMTPAKIYSQFVLSRQVTAIERREILTMLGKKAENDRLATTSGNDRGTRINLYTHDTSLRIPGIKNMGPVDYSDKMYRIFSGSKINLNITLRSILTGIPLRALDIMSAGGFLLSNYQAELCEYFVPGEDFDYYEDYDDLMNKIDYYLSHDKERGDIARAGWEKVRTEHSLERRLDEMEAML
ncbi:spore maturation protein CgeB [Lachnospiraceae bacterium XBB2008]|nr:spore maturation protein CgeB [Lachnospiraceae bacterium XBB2008]